MKAAINLDTGLLIASSSNSDDATMLENAAAAGFVNVEVRVVTNAEHDALVAARDLAHTTLADRRSSAIAKTYADVDEVYTIAIGNRAEEYKQAEADARAYAAAGYTGTPTAYVSGWATAKGLTNQQSADAIIARADALTAAKLSLRNQRFVSQAAMSAATTRSELDAAVATWDAYVAATKAALA